MNLITASENNDVETIKKLLNNGEDINVCTVYQNTPLHLAVVKGHVDVTKLLLKNGADVNARNIFQNTPLHLATLNNRAEIVKILLEYGADINSKNIEDDIPLYLAIRDGCVDIAKVLIENGADAKSNADNETIKVALESIKYDTVIKKLANIANLIKEKYGTNPRDEIDTLQFMENILKSSSDDIL